MDGTDRKDKDERSTFNVQLSTFNRQKQGNSRSEDERSTFNIQRSTFNGQQEGSKNKQFDLHQRLLRYAADIIRLVEMLPKTRAGNHVGGQLIRCGTSPLGNHGEAQAAESVDDFVHKMKICLKELRESLRWIQLIRIVPLVRTREHMAHVDCMLGETDELIRIFHKSIQTATRNARP